MSRYPKKPVTAVPNTERQRPVQPKYGAVYDSLLRSIRRGEYPSGGKLPTETELVEQFKVSRITVIRALRDLQALGVVRRRRGSGSFVEGPKQSKFASVGLLFPPLEPGSIFATVHQALLREAQKREWQILFHEVMENTSVQEAQAALEPLWQNDLRGLLYLPLPVRSQCAEINEFIAGQCVARKLPLILLDRDLHKLHDRSRFDVVGSDNELGGFLAGRHLIQRGCRRILFLTDAREHPTAEARVEGVANAVRLEPSAQLQVCSGDGDDREALARMLAEHRPDAIACVNDMTAAKAMRQLLKMGVKIPEQIKLTGFDDTSTAALLAVPLTTVRQSPEAMAIQAMSVLQQRAERPDLPAITLSIACSLVGRESTAAHQG
jgi:DNA-binding LacI/PurR family transcriptional regulator